MGNLLLGIENRRFIRSVCYTFLSWPSNCAIL